MKNLLGITASVISLSGLSGCGSGTQPLPDGPVSTTRTVGALQFKLELPKRVFKAGETIPMQMTITNTSNRDIRFGWSTISPLTFGTTTRTGNFYWYSGRELGNGGDQYSTQVIKINEEFKRSVDWLQDRTNLGGYWPSETTPPSQITPGRYFITGWMSAKVGVREELIVDSNGLTHLNRPDEATYPKTVALTEWEAEPIEIEILPADSL